MAARTGHDRDRTRGNRGGPGVPRGRERAGAAALGRNRERAPARGRAAAAAPARRHVQLARRSRRGGGRQPAAGPDQRSVRGARGTLAQAVLGRSLDELVGPATIAYVRSPDPQDSAAPAQHRVEDAALKGTFLLTATPLSTHEGRTVGRVLVARDITQQTRLEAERAALRERLGQSEKLASLGQFVAGIAHEMNNPLQGVLGHLELLIDMTEAARPVRRELKQIYLEADRAAKIVHNLLVFTGSHRMQRQRIPLDRIVTRALASRTAHLRKTNVT